MYLPNVIRIVALYDIWTSQLYTVVWYSIKKNAFLHNFSRTNNKRARRRMRTDHHNSHHQDRKEEHNNHLLNNLPLPPTDHKFEHGVDLVTSPQQREPENTSVVRTQLEFLYWCFPSLTALCTPDLMCCVSTLCLLLLGGSLAMKFNTPVTNEEILVGDSVFTFQYCNMLDTAKFCWTCTDNEAHFLLESEHDGWIVLAFSPEWVMSDSDAVIGM